MNIFKELHTDVGCPIPAHGCLTAWAKNGVLTLKGSVATADERKQAQTIAAGVPNVQQVLNQIEVKR